MGFDGDPDTILVQLVWRPDYFMHAFSPSGPGIAELHHSAWVASLSFN